MLNTYIIRALDINRISDKSNFPKTLYVIFLGSSHLLDKVYKTCHTE